jgi:hypothetical protein
MAQLKKSLNKIWVQHKDEKRPFQTTEKSFAFLKTMGEKQKDKSIVPIYEQIEDPNIPKVLVTPQGNFEILPKKKLDKSKKEIDLSELEDESLSLGGKTTEQVKIDKRFKENK